MAEMHAQVKRQCSWIPTCAGNTSQGAFKSSYANLRQHELAKPAADRETIAEAIETAAASARAVDPTFQPQYDPRLLAE